MNKSLFCECNMCKYVCHDIHYTISFFFENIVHVVLILYTFELSLIIESASLNNG